MGTLSLSNVFGELENGLLLVTCPTWVHVLNKLAKSRNKNQLFNHINNSSFQVNHVLFPGDRYLGLVYCDFLQYISNGSKC